MNPIKLLVTLGFVSLLLGIAGTWHLQPLREWSDLNTFGKVFGIVIPSSCMGILIVMWIMSLFKKK